MALEYLDLPIIGKHDLTIDKDKFIKSLEELESLIKDKSCVNSEKFAKKVMFSQELKSNNVIEGIDDDLLTIEDVINDVGKVLDEESRKRIVNLHNGYNYILSNRDINKESLKELYRLLSNGLLKKEDLDRMGEYYREDKVYILEKRRIDMELKEGIDYTLIDKYMNILLEYINNKDLTCNSFVKSQIIHFYFVYIHPYFDVNGRTSRTLAMWYLLNNKAYPYIIFNRGITMDQKNYDRYIKDAKEFSNISFFIKYMIERVLVELEKEVVINNIKQENNLKLTSIDYQTLIYMLSMKEEINVLNFVSFYRRFNSYKSVKDIYEEMIISLKEKGILEIVRTNNKVMFDNYSNEIYKISIPDSSDYKVRRLKLDT